MATSHVVEYGPGGFDPSKPNNNIINEYDVQIPAEQTNRDTLHTKARQALTANATYLAITTPNAAQNAAQVKALTREVNALIKLMLGALEDVSGT